MPTPTPLQCDERVTLSSDRRTVPQLLAAAREGHRRGQRLLQRHAYLQEAMAYSAPPDAGAANWHQRYCEVTHGECVQGCAAGPCKREAKQE
jgi:hypothetical protein